MADEIITRKEAMSLGLKRYFTGKPCRHGHVAERQANNGTCHVCRAEILIKFHDCHPGQQAVWGAKYRRDAPHRAKGYAQKSYQKHKIKRNAQNKAYREEHRAKIYAKAKEYIAKNPDLIRSIKRNNRARRGSVEGIHSVLDIRRIYNSQKGKCACCRVGLRKIGYHVDHIIPLALGGTNYPNNIQILCANCNLRKSAKHPIIFARELGMLL